MASTLITDQALDVYAENEAFSAPVVQSDGTIWVFWSATAATFKGSYSKDGGQTWTTAPTVFTHNEPAWQNAYFVGPISAFIDKHDNLWLSSTHNINGGTPVVTVARPNTAKTDWVIQSTFDPRSSMNIYGGGSAAIEGMAFPVPGSSTDYFFLLAASSGNVNGRAVGMHYRWRVNGLVGTGTPTLTFDSEDQFWDRVDADVTGIGASVEFRHTGDGKTPVGSGLEYWVQSSWHDAPVTTAILHRWTWNGTTFVRQADVNLGDSYRSQLIWDPTQDKLWSGHDRGFHRMSTTGVAEATVAAIPTFKSGTTNNYRIRDGLVLAGNRPVVPVMVLEEGYLGLARANPDLTGWDFVTLQASGVGTTETNPQARMARGINVARVAWRETPLTGAANKVWYTQHTYNTAPTAPTLNVPSSGATVGNDTTITFSWTHHDPEGDPQGSYSLRRSADGGATYTYWNGSAWQASQVWVATAAQSVAVPSVTFERLDAPYQWSVATQDPAGLTGPFAADRTFQFVVPREGWGQVFI